MPGPSAIRTLIVAALAILHLTAGSARALDKQGSAHAGAVSGEASGFAASGSVLLGVAPYNPSYAARPDNTGLAFGRIAPHFDVDLIGSRLSIPIDFNVFSDRHQVGFGKLFPSEFDVISGLTSTWPIGPSALEIGARFERDMPVDRGSFTQTYGDVRVRWLGSLAALDPKVPGFLDGGDVTGHLTLGWFTVNPSYAARPDNSGRALLRYGAHIAIAAFDGRLVGGLDTTLFTDRRVNAVRPSELDFTVDLGTGWDDFELRLAYERDMPVDHGGLVQHFVMLNATFSFEIVDNPNAGPDPVPPSKVGTCVR